MLARRFTVVCLAVTLFGMGLAALVAETKSRDLGVAIPCVFDDGLRCLPPDLR